jgi:hypothetical protein
MYQKSSSSVGWQHLTYVAHEANMNADNLFTTPLSQACCWTAGLRFPSADGQHVLPAIELPEAAGQNLISVANKHFAGTGIRCVY